MRAFHNDYDNPATDKPVSDNAVAQTPGTRKVLPAPGKPLSFEESKAWLFVKHEEALRELAK